MPRRLPALRMLLLVLVTLGVTGMHTMGHPSGSHRATPLMASHALVGTEAHAAFVPVQWVVLPHEGGGLDPSDVCLAVLTTFGLAVVIAWLLLAVWRALAGSKAILAVVAVHGRGPPLRPAFGLVLADLSVQRT